MELSNYDALWLTLFGEAEGEPIEGQIGVANVIRTRALESGLSIREVCLQPKQFSCWNKDSPRYPILETLSENLKTESPIITQLKWISAGILGGSVLDNTKGANHYLTKIEYLDTDAPNWSKVAEYKRQLGKHVFLWLHR